MSFVYLDHAASSWPKPPAVIEAMQRCMVESGANPGRGSHQMAVQASRTVFEGRKQLAKLFGIRNPNDLVFTLNTTMALNMAILGLLKEGDHVVTTMVEHNSVRRPLEYVARMRGVTVTYVKSDLQGVIAIDDIVQAMQPNTALVVCSHSSNLLGTIAPVASIGQLCRERNIPFLLDAAQSAGSLPIDVGQLGVQLLAFPGHKGLLGPQGTGGLYIAPELDIAPFLYGGTGSQSEAIDQPTVRPDRYESGTPNTPGIAGLIQGVKYVLEQTPARIHQHEFELVQQLMEALAGIDGVKLLGPALGENKTGIVSFLVHEADSSELSFILDQSFQIAVRAGYHCTPLAHESIGTLATGAVRASVGPFSTKEDVLKLADAVREIAKHVTA